MQAQYQAVIDAYTLTAIDFDIEGVAVADGPSVDRRNAAIAGRSRPPRLLGGTWPSLTHFRSPSMA